MEFDVAQLWDAGQVAGLAGIFWRMGRFTALVEFMDLRLKALEKLEE